MTSKYLPRIPTPAMIEAGTTSKLKGERVRDVWAAMWDAAPTSLPLKRADPPTEPGWYWARIRNEDYRPQPLAVFRANGELVAAWGHPPLPLDGFEWFGPIPLPEVEP